MWSVISMRAVWATMMLTSVVTTVVMVLTMRMAMRAWLRWARAPSIPAMVAVTLAVGATLKGAITTTSAIVTWRTNIYNNEAIIATDTKRYTRRTTSTIICRSTAHCYYRKHKG